MNLTRDFSFDMVPSYTYQKREKLKEIDISYYEMKELKETFKQNPIIFSQHEFVNEYGTEELGANVRRFLVQELEILSFIVGKGK